MSFIPYSGEVDKEENQWWLEREVSLIENLHEEEGRTPKKEIGEKLGCKYWGAHPLQQRPQGGRQAGHLPQERARQVRTRRVARPEPGGPRRPVRPAHRAVGQPVTIRRIEMIPV